MRLDTPYSPGPWWTNGCWIHADPQHGVGADGCVVALTYVGPGAALKEHAKGNARLLAAAPELYAAAQAVAALWGRRRHDAESDPVWRMLQTALAKAEEPKKPTRDHFEGAVHDKAGAELGENRDREQVVRLDLTHTRGTAVSQTILILSHNAALVLLHTLANLGL